MKTTKASKSQVLEKTNIPCLYRATRSGFYYGIFTRGGSQIKKSLKTTDKEQARRRLEELRQNIAKLNSKEGKETLFAVQHKETKLLNGGLAKSWLDNHGPKMKPYSRERRASAIKALASYFPNTVRSISKSHVEKWASSRMKSAAARTFNIERETLIQILDYAVREGLILDNPARVIHRMKQSKPKLVVPTRPQFQSLLAKLRGQDVRYQDAANLCELLAYSGCRLREATAMTWEDVDFKKKTFVVTGGERGTKNHEVRTVPLFPALEKLLLRLKGSLSNPPLPTDRIIPINDAKNAISTACEKASLPHFHHHTFRHFFCSNAIELGIDFKVIAGWLGHKDGGVLVARTYGHLRDEHSAAMAKKMTFDSNSDSTEPPEK